MINQIFSVVIYLFVLYPCWLSVAVKYVWCSFVDGFKPK
jgi:hypothetical protein